jgi:hypothetical protein
MKIFAVKVNRMDKIVEGSSVSLPFAIRPELAKYIRRVPAWILYSQNFIDASAGRSAGSRI